MVKIRWTNAALDDLNAVHDRAMQSSAVYADQLVERLVARTNVLETFPRIGRQVPGFGNSIIRELTEGNYRLVYRVISNERIDITRVHHAAQPLTNPG